MTSPETIDSADFEDIVDMAFPGDGEPVEMDAFIHRLQDLSEDDLDDGEAGVNVSTVAVVVDTLQDSLPEAEVSIDRQTDANVTVRVVVDGDETDIEAIQSRVPHLIDAATAPSPTHIETEVVSAARDGDESNADDEPGAVIIP